MTYEDYGKKLEELEEKHNKEKNDLAKKYAESNNPYKAGDIITDRYGVTIIIEVIGVYFSFCVPSMRYYGTELKKDGTPKKSGKKSWIYQNNIIP